MLNKWTNHAGLTRLMSKVVVDDQYDSEGSDVTVTQLIDSAYRQRLLREASRSTSGTFEVDVGDRLFAVFGRAIHLVIEQSAKSPTAPEVAAVLAQISTPSKIVAVEKRYHAEDLGVRWSGRVDVLREEERETGPVLILEDHKVCSVWEYILGSGLQWERQLNLLAYLIRRNGGRVGELAVNQYFRDWRKRETKTGGYPKYQYARKVVRLWPVSEQAEYLQERIREYMNPNPTPCTDTERWVRGQKFAVMWPTRRRALKLCDSRMEAERFIESKNIEAHEALVQARSMPNATPEEKAAVKKSQTRANRFCKGMKDIRIEERPGSSVRCEDYCELKPICKHYEYEIAPDDDE